MKIIRRGLPEMSIEEFADTNDLTMVIEKGYMPLAGMRTTAWFKDAEIRDGSCLASPFGCGSTEAEAIAHYASRISGQTMVVRREYDIEVPVLTVGS